MNKIEETIDFKKLIPQDTTFKTQSGDEYLVRSITLEDMAHWQNSIGEKKLEEAFDGKNYEIIAKCIYRLLSLDDRRKFMSETIIDINEDGDEVEVKITGPQVFLRSLRGGISDEQNLYLALLKARGIDADVLMGNLESQVDETKKKEISH